MMDRWQKFRSSTIRGFLISFRPRPVYLVDYLCYRALYSFKALFHQFMGYLRQIGDFDESSLKFRRTILQRSELGVDTPVYGRGQGGSGTVLISNRSNTSHLFGDFQMLGGEARGSYHMQRRFRFWSDATSWRSGADLLTRLRRLSSMVGANVGERGLTFTVTLLL